LTQKFLNLVIFFKSSESCADHRLATPVLLCSAAAQNENELVFECILTSYSKLQALLLMCSKFEWWC